MSGCGGNWVGRRGVNILQSKIYRRAGDFVVGWMDGAADAFVEGLRAGMAGGHGCEECRANESSRVELRQSAACTWL